MWYINPTFQCEVQAKVVDKPKEGFPSTALEQAAIKDYREVM